MGLMREYKKNVKADEKVCLFNSIFLICPWDFPGGPVVKNPPCDAGDTGSMPGRETKIPRTPTAEPTRHN